MKSITESLDEIEARVAVPPNDEREENECPRCHATLHIKPGHDFDDGDLCHSCHAELFTQIITERDRLAQALRVATGVMKSHCVCSIAGHCNLCFAREEMAKILAGEE